MPFEEARLVIEHRHGGRRGQGRMADSGEQERLVRASGGEQRPGHAQGVRGEDVVVGEAVDEQD